MAETRRGGRPLLRPPRRSASAEERRRSAAPRRRLLAVDDVLGLVDGLVGFVLHGRLELIELALVLEVLIIGEVAGRFLGPALQVIHVLSHARLLPAAST